MEAMDMIYDALADANGNTVPVCKLVQELQELGCTAHVVEKALEALVDVNVICRERGEEGRVGSVIPKD
eukprot:425622-Karenia_brevis.AAC.1